MAKSNFIVRGGADFSGITKAIAKTQTQFKTFQSNIGKSVKAVTATLGTIAIGSLIKDSTKMAMGVESSLDNIKRNMEQSSSFFNNWVETQSRAWGMGKAEAYKYGSTFSNLLDSFMTNSKQTADQTQKLMKAAAIISSKTGRSYDDVSERIRSGMMGSTEAIEDLGVYTQISMLESTKAFKQFANGKSWAQLNFQTQQQIRLAAILEQTYDRYGDTLADTTQTRQAMFLASLKNIQLNIGQAFLPIYNTVLPALTALANKIEAVTSVFAQFTQALFGKVAAGATETQEQADAMSNLGDETQKAGKKAKNALAGFDQLNTLSFGSDSEGSGGTAAQSSVTNPSDKNSTIDPGIQKMADNIKKIFEPITVAFENLKKSAEPLISTVSEYLKSFYDNVLVPFGSWVINDAIPAFLNLLSGALTVLNPMLQAFEPLASWLWTNFLQPIATWTGETFVTAVNGVAEALKSIGAWMSENKPIVEGIVITISAFFAVWKVTELLSFIETSGGIVVALKKIATAISACTIAKLADKAETIALTALYAKDFVVSLAKTTVELIKQAAKWTASTAAMLANKIALAASTVAQLAMTAATTAWNVVCGIATVVTTAFGAAVAFLTSPIGLVVIAIAAVIAIVVLLVKHWDDVKKAASVCWDWIVGVWQKASGWFSTNIVQPVGNFFTGMWDGIKAGASGAWNGIKSGFTTAFDFIKKGIKLYINGYITVIEVFVNAFIKGINFIISGLNKISFDIPDWVPGLGGKNFGINLNQVKEISIPRLKTGGITNGEMLATIGDNPGGREVVSPLDDLLGMIKDTVSNTAKTKDSPTTIILKIGETELGKVVVDAMRKANNKSGYTVLEI